jgi:hypothetical protein
MKVHTKYLIGTAPLFSLVAWTKKNRLSEKVGRKEVEVGQLKGNESAA